MVMRILTCWINTNINGNEWTVIYLHNQIQQKLIKLYNYADDTDIWDAPAYNKRKRIINCEKVSSTYGIHWTSIYKLKNQIAIPVSKTVTDTNNPAFILEEEYKGKDGKWQLLSEYKIMNTEFKD